MLAYSPLLSFFQGIHNIFIVIPQFLVTGLSAAIFAIFDGAAAAPGHAPGAEAETGRNSVVYVFRYVRFHFPLLLWSGGVEARGGFPFIESPFADAPPPS